MSEETATNPVDGEDTAAATLEAEAGVETEGQEAETLYDDDGNPIEEPTDEEIELDTDLKIKVPKTQAQKVREALLRQADYTRKTQEVAEQRKVLETERQNLHQASAAEINAYATAQSIGQQLAAYSQVNWQAEMQAANANYDEDAKANVQAQFMRYTQLKDAQQAAMGQLQALRQQRLSSQQQETARLIEQGRAALTKDVPGWNDDLKAKLVGFAAEYGFSQDELSDLEADPRVARVLHAAYEGTAAKRAASKLANLAKGQSVQPAKTLKGTSGSSPVRADTNDFKAFEKLAAQRLSTG